MKKQKGMTLIEVMVAMLVLSIAMIGGISFFTSAYRINYSYLESANRLDHALRYVERLKVQRRNYPTKGYFANIGGNGFTVFFVNSEPSDIGPEPYYYEDFTTSVVKIPAKSYVNFTYYQNPARQFYDEKSPANTGYDDNIAGSYTREVYVPSPWHAYTSNINSWKRVNEEYTVADAFQQRLHEMSNGQFVRINGDGAPTSVNTYFRYTYNKSNVNNVNDARYGDYDAFMEIPFSTLTQGARSSWNSTASPVISKDFSLSTVPNGLPNEGTPLYAYYYIERRNNATNPYDTYGYYYGTYSPSNLYLTSGAEVEGGESSGLGNEILTPHSLRFYTQLPTVGSGNNYEDVSLRQMVTTSGAFPSIKSGPDGTNCRISKKFEDPDKADVLMPLSAEKGGYGSHITHIARVYTNQAGREKVYSYHQWNYWNWPGSPGTENTGGAPIKYPTSATTNYYTQNLFRFYIYTSLTNENQKRMTKFRRSVYISVYPVPTEQAAKELRDYLAENYKTDINGAVTYMKSLATPGNSKYKGYKIIMIPFIQLYAHDTNSTLCERLD